MDKTLLSFRNEIIVQMTKENKFIFYKNSFKLNIKLF